MIKKYFFSSKLWFSVKELEIIKFSRYKEKLKLFRFIPPEGSKRFSKATQERPSISSKFKNER